MRLLCAFRTISTEQVDERFLANPGQPGFAGNNHVVFPVRFGTFTILGLDQVHKPRVRLEPIAHLTVAQFRVQCRTATNRQL